MGGAVSSGSDNNELVDNLMSGHYIRTKKVEQVFRALDRADYMTPEAWDHAYKDLAWRNGPLHLSSPCIYSEVMEGLELSDGLSFLNIGSGTGYLSSLVGLILGSQGINHGVEVHPDVYEYALTRLALLLDTSPVIDDFDFCQPKFYNGNGLCLVPLKAGYDRVYCGAACPTEYEPYFRNLIKVGGILVMPLNDTLVQVRRVSNNKWVTRSLLSVTFAPLRVPTREETTKLLILDVQRPPRLEVLSRGAVRVALRTHVTRAHPELLERTRRAPPRARPSCLRRICIPVEPPAAVEGLNVLHDLDAESGADEMNALLSLVINMGHNRVAGALRFDQTDSNSSIDSDQADLEEPPPSEHVGDPNEPARDAGEPSELKSSGNENYDNGRSESDDYDSDGSVARKSRTRVGLRKSRSANQSRNSDTSKRNKRSTRNSSKTQRRDRSSQSSKTKKRDSSVASRMKKRSGDRSSGADDGRGSAAKERTRSTRSKCSSCERRLSSSETKEDIEPSTSSAADTGKTQNKRKSKDSKGEMEEKASSSNSSSNDDSPVAPSDVEETGKPSKVLTRVDMEWEESKTDTLEASDEDEDTSPKRRIKRQKLDSGIGESTPSSSSPTKYHADESNTDDYTDIDDDADEWRPKVKESRPWGAADARCVRLSQLMKHSVHQLPLPPALKKFVNLDRLHQQ